MAYRPNVKKFEPAPYGTARIKKGKKGQLIVWYSDENEGDFAGKKYAATEWPDWVKPKSLEGKEWKVKLNPKKQVIYTITPINGMFTGKCVGFSSQEGQEPVPQFQEDQWGGYQYFYPLIEITSGDESCIGCVLPYLWTDGLSEYGKRLRYLFDSDDEGLVEYPPFGDRSVHIPKLIEFLDVIGVWEKGPLKFSDNILPKLQKRVLKANKEFQFVLKNGFFSTLMTDDSSSTTSVVWDDDEPETQPYESEDVAEESNDDFENWDD